MSGKAPLRTFPGKRGSLLIRRLSSIARSNDTTRRQERERSKEDGDPNALACDGVLLRRRPQSADPMFLRFVDGRPVSAVTIDFLQAWCEELPVQAISALVLIWENASWHTSPAVRAWMRSHTQTVKQTGKGVRILPCRLPSKSPWLHPIEATWVHGKRTVSEADRILSTGELEARGCA